MHDIYLALSRVQHYHLILYEIWPAKLEFLQVFIVYVISLVLRNLIPFVQNEECKIRRMLLSHFFPFQQNIRHLDEDKIQLLLLNMFTNIPTYKSKLI